MLDMFIDIESVPLWELILRIVLAAFCGLVIGWDRDAKNKPIDFRAYMIVAVATCLLALVGLELEYAYSGNGSELGIDLSKIIAGVMTGVGFLGAGAIIQQGDKKIIGTATGASIWASAGMGMALGFGFYTLSIIGFLMIAGILMLGGVFMKRAFDQEDNEDV